MQQIEGIILDEKCSVNYVDLTDARRLQAGANDALLNSRNCHASVTMQARNHINGSSPAPDVYPYLIDSTRHVAASSALAG